MNRQLAAVELTELLLLKHEIYSSNMGHFQKSYFPLKS